MSPAIDGPASASVSESAVAPISPNLIMTFSCLGAKATPSSLRVTRKGYEISVKLTEIRILRPNILRKLHLS
jgi:hypothetical protein